MNKEYYDLLESLYWIAFRTPNPSKRLIIENDKLLADSAKLLYNYLTPDFNEFLPTSGEIIAVAGVKNDKTDKIDEVNITSFTPDMEICASDDMIIAMGGRYYYGVCLLAGKLRDVFPPAPDLSTHATRNKGIVHDIAFYCYNTHRPIQAKALSKLFDVVLPDFNLHSPPLNTIKAWITEFNKNTYHPSATKPQISMRYHNIFAAISNTIREN